MNPTQAREIAFKALFQLEFTPRNEEEYYQELAVEIAVDEEIVENRRLTYIKNAVKGTRENLSEIDEMIKSRLKKGWTLSRLSTADRSILRLAVYEMIFAEPKIPTGVVINEAVELAKQYGADESSRFINGILDAINREHKAQ